MKNDEYHKKFVSDLFRMYIRSCDDADMLRSIEQMATERQVTLFFEMKPLSKVKKNLKHKLKKPVAKRKRK